MANTELETTFFEKIGKIFKKDPGELSRDTRFAEDLRAGSQSMFAVAANLERLTGKPVSFTDVNQCVTLGEALDVAAGLGAESA
jgi:acyl carrier protein